MSEKVYCNKCYYHKNKEHGKLDDICGHQDNLVDTPTKRICGRCSTININNDCSLYEEIVLTEHEKFWLKYGNGLPQFSLLVVVIWSVALAIIRLF